MKPSLGKKCFYALPAVLFYAGVLIHLKSICAVSLMILAQILVYMLSRRRGALVYAFSYSVPMAICVSLNCLFSERLTAYYIWMVLAIIFALSITMGSRLLKAIPRNTTAMWMGVFIILVEFSFMAGLLSVL